MEKIEIIEVGSAISYQQVHELLNEAHTENRKNGFHVKTADMSPDELRARVGPDGKCFAALADGFLAGVTAVRYVKLNKWFAHGLTADQNLIGVHPSFRGKRISSMLHQRVIAEARERGAAQIRLNTAYNNVNMQRTALHWGFRYVDFFAAKGLDHYSVTLCKWLTEDAPSPLRCRCRYFAKKIYTILRYRRGGSSRI